MNRKLRRKRQKANRKSPDGTPEAALGRAEMALQAGRWAEAARFFRDVVKARPDHAASWANLGALHMQSGDAENAAAALDKALALEPDSVPVLGNLANLRKQLGDNEGAVGFYRQALVLAPENAQLWHDFTRVKRFRAGDADVTAMERLHGDARLDDQGRMYAAFALAKAHEDMGEFDRAFGYLAEGNRLRRATLRFDIDAERATFERLIRVFDAAFMAARADVGDPDERPVFVLGMPRSGTTLIEQIVASHSQVFGAGELSDLSDVLGDAVPGFPEAAAVLPGPSFQEIGKAYVNRVSKLAPGVKRITDKMPRNFLFLGMLALTLPNAKIIHCRRSPMDTCVSCFALHFPYGQEFSYDLAELGAYYRLYRRLMDHWHRVLPGRVLDVTYEDVVTDPEPHARRLIEFCALEWEDACLDFHTSRRQVTTASAAQVREPVHTRSVARWQRFARHLAPLREALGDYADEG